jgi:hypothetical protein
MKSTKFDKSADTQAGLRLQSGFRYQSMKSTKLDKSNSLECGRKSADTQAGLRLQSGFQYQSMKSTKFDKSAAPIPVFEILSSKSSMREASWF